MKSDLFIPPEEADKNNYYLFLFSRLNGLGSKTIISLLQKFGSPSNLYQALLDQRQILNNKIYYLLRDKDFILESKKAFEALAEDYITILNPLYPPNLKNIYDPPLFLFYKGNVDLLKNEYLLTIVGSRTSTNYHSSTVKSIFNDLKQTPLVIVSGLAIGIDALSHREALLNNLPTIAVLGSGLSKEILYPQENVALAEEIIAKGGLLISEQSSQTKTQLYHFPKRNRILAGLSKATIVISGALKSGTLITAQVALDEGREVLALPGNVNLKLSQGPNKLIKEGASVIDSALDIFKIYNIDKEILRADIILNNPEQAKIYALLQAEATNLLDLSKSLALPLAKVNVLISQMELAGIVRYNNLNQLEIIL